MQKAYNKLYLIQKKMFTWDKMSKWKKCEYYGGIWYFLDLYKWIPKFITLATERKERQ